MTVAVLDRESFTRLLGPCEQLLSRESEKYAEADTQSAATAAEQQDIFIGACVLMASGIRCVDAHFVTGDAVKDLLWCVTQTRPRRPRRQSAAFGPIAECLFHRVRIALSCS